jgi:hypothetical protein
MAALGGYHLFSTMQGRPFNAVGEEQFIRTLVDITKPRRRSAPLSMKQPQRSASGAKTGPSAGSRRR